MTRCLRRCTLAGMLTPAGTRTPSDVNHLQLFWDPAAMSQIATWLN